MRELLERLRREGNGLLLLTSGSRLLQTTLLNRAEILRYFDLEHSYFLGDYLSKQVAIEEAVKRLEPEIVFHIGDAPSDSRALKYAEGIIDHSIDRLTSKTYNGEEYNHLINIYGWFFSATKA